MEFSPANDEIRVKTYTPVLDQFETDADSQFILPYDLQCRGFQVLGANTNCGTCDPKADGTLVNNGNGTFDYTPSLGFSGSDSFVYEICDTRGTCDTATVAITINSAAPVTLEVRVAAGSDDAEERDTGKVSLSSSDLELVQESTTQIVGVRFIGITIPPGATIEQAHIQFKADETQSESTSLTIQGEAADNAATFVSSSGNISARGRTAATAAWSLVPAWAMKGEAGPGQRTSDISAVIQEIVNRPGWTSGNSLVIIITGSGKRVAESYNGDQAGAPLLHVEYRTP